MDNKMVVLFTLSYPYTIGKEDTFLSKELDLLVNSFSKVIVFPSCESENKYHFSNKLDINTSLAKHLQKQINIFTYFFRGKLYKLIISEILSNYKSIKYPKKVILYTINLIRILEWINLYFNQIITNDEKKVIIYTYWFTFITSALSYYYKDSKNVKVITRAHGIDLFEYRNGNYIPYRKFSIKNLEKVYLVSEFGKNYLIKKYPEYENKYYTFPIGVVADFKINPLNSSNVFHFVSCSNVDSNKNVHIILEALINIAEINKEVTIKWTHFGEGDLFNILKNKAKSLKLSNLQVELKGYKENSYIRNFYEKQSINAFITTSISEGGRPISIQEAICFGIPVIATKVGGIPEIINEKNGYLLSSKCSQEELVNAIESVLFEKETWNAKREEAIKTCMEKCNSEKFSRMFIDELKKL